MNTSKWGGRWGSDGLMMPLGYARPGLELWRHPNLVQTQDEQGKHFFLPDPKLYWMEEGTEPCWVDPNGGEWDLFDDDYYLPRMRNEVVGQITIKQFNNNDAIIFPVKDGKPNLEWYKSDYHIVFMRNRKSAEICPIVFKYSNEGYGCVDETKPRTDGYCSTIGMSFQEKLQVARDALKWVRDNHHDGDRDVADKVDSTLKAIE